MTRRDDLTLGIEPDPLTLADRAAERRGFEEVGRPLDADLRLVEVVRYVRRCKQFTDAAVAAGVATYYGDQIRRWAREATDGDGHK